MSKKVVFVLGAGASKHVGFPLGMKLLKEIIGDNSRYQNWNDHDYLELKNFQEELRFSGLLSVDSFLEQNRHFEKLGKFLITVHLARKENKNWPFIITEKDRDVNSESDDNNWYRELWRNLIRRRSELTNGSISFITFNYDRSFEFFLEKAFKHSFYGDVDPHSRSESLYSELKKIKIIHLYGQIGYLPWQTPNPAERTFERPYEQHTSYEVSEFWHFSEKIKLIRNNETVSSPEFAQARELIQNADFVYFLGFGYDSVNIDRLSGQQDVFDQQEISGTALGLGEAEIQRIKDHFYPQDPDKKGVFPKIKIYDFLKEKIDWRKF